MLLKNFQITVTTLEFHVYKDSVMMFADQNMSQTIIILVWFHNFIYLIQRRMFHT